MLGLRTPEVLLTGLDGYGGQGPLIGMRGRDDPIHQLRQHMQSNVVRALSCERLHATRRAPQL